MKNNRKEESQGKSNPAAFWRVNKKIAREVGMNSAALLADLISKRNYFVKNDRLSFGGYFFNTAENIEADTGLSSHERRAALKALQRKGWLVIDKRDCPAKNYFLIRDDLIDRFLMSSSVEIEGIGVEEVNGNNNKSNKKKVNENKHRGIIIKDNCKPGRDNYMKSTSAKNAEVGYTGKSEEEPTEIVQSVLVSAEPGPFDHLFD